MGVQSSFANDTNLILSSAHKVEEKETYKSDDVSMHLEILLSMIKM